MGLNRMSWDGLPRGDWRDIVGYEGRYKINQNGVVWSAFKRGPVASRIARNGYYTVALAIGSEYKTFTVHRLLAKTFIPNPENKPCINHMDGNKTNNDLSNLEWCTYRENTLDILARGVWFGTRPVLNPRKIDRIKRLFAGGISQSKIAQKMGVDPTTIGEVIKGTYCLLTRGERSGQYNRTLGREIVEKLDQ